MLEKKEFPILEFDCDKKAKIEPGELIQKKNVPDCCVITFFADVIGELLRNGKLKQIACINTETVCLPVYVTECDGRTVGIVQGYVGSAGSAGLLEELIATGFSRFIVCGGAGVLQRNIQVGHLVVPYSAVRDEGTSYHYMAPSREIECNKHALDVIEGFLITEKIPFIKAKTWTTDASYRETEEKIALRVSEGCVTVEMEAAALFAVSEFRGVTLGQILYGGDDLSGGEWDKREWNSRNDIRRNLVELSLKICLKL